MKVGLVIGLVTSSHYCLWLPNIGVGGPLSSENQRLQWLMPGAIPIPAVWIHLSREIIRVIHKAFLQLDVGPTKQSPLAVCGHISLAEQQRKE